MNYTVSGRLMEAAFGGNGEYIFLWSRDSANDNWYVLETNDLKLIGDRQSKFVGCQLLSEMIVLFANVLGQRHASRADHSRNMIIPHAVHPCFVTLDESGSLSILLVVNGPGHLTRTETSTSTLRHVTSGCFLPKAHAILLITQHNFRVEYFVLDLPQNLLQTSWRVEACALHKLKLEKLKKLDITTSSVALYETAETTYIRIFCQNKNLYEFCL